MFLTRTCCGISNTALKQTGNQFPIFPRAVRDQRLDTIEICLYISLIYKQRKQEKSYLNHPSLFVAESSIGNIYFYILVLNTRMKCATEQGRVSNSGTGWGYFELTADRSVSREKFCT